MATTEIATQVVEPVEGNIQEERTAFERAVQAITGTEDKENPPVIETAPPEENIQKVEQTEKKESKSDVYLKLAKQEQQIRKLTKEIESAKRINPKEDFIKLAQKDPSAAVKELGLTEQQLINLYLSGSLESGTTNDTKQGTLTPLELEVQTLKEELQKYKQDQQDAVVNSAVAEELKGLRNELAANEDKYPLVKAFLDEGSIQYAFEQAQIAYRETGIIAPFDVILEAVEEDYSERYLKRVEPVLARKTAPPLSDKKIETPVTNSTTLSRKTSQAPMGTKELTREERFQRAVSALNK